MGWRDALDATTMTSITVEQAYQYSGADLKVEMYNTERAGCKVKVDFPGSPTDNGTFKIFCSDHAAPGAVPDSSQTVAGSDWAEYQVITIDNAYDDEWQDFEIGGHKFFAFSLQRDGSTDTLTDSDLKIRRDGVSS
jgi:hypothetical protein